MFSTSMIASSTTTPSAITNPARTIDVDRLPRAVEDQPGGDQRERDRDEADQRGAPLEQERAEDEDHEQRADAAAPS